MSGAPAFGLVGDVGGTNIRLAIVRRSGDQPRLDAIWTDRGDNHPSVEAAIAAFLAAEGQAPPERIALAVAGPVVGGAVAFTNRGWSLSEEGLRRAGFAKARLINDFAALARSAPALAGEGLTNIGRPLSGDPEAPIAVIGPGTGLGAAVFLPLRPEPLVLPTEGGHIAFAPNDETEIEVLRRLTARFGRVSVERLLSGQGLENLYRALADIEGEEVDDCSAPEITARGLSGDPACHRTLQRFLAILASAAGDFALAYGARGGVYLGGGILPRIAGIIDAAAFRARFEDKGRMTPFVQAIPTRIILDPCAALIGAALSLTP